MAIERKNIVPFLDSASVIGKYLLHENARIGIIDANRDLHLFKRQDGWIRLGFIARDKYARITPCERCKHGEDSQQYEQAFHGRFCSGIRTRPLSVPT